MYIMGTNLTRGRTIANACSRVLRDLRLLDNAVSTSPAAITEPQHARIIALTGSGLATSAIFTALEAIPTE